MKKRMVSVLLSLTMVAASIAGCGSGSIGTSAGTDEAVASEKTEDASEKTDAADAAQTGDSYEAADAGIFTSTFTDIEGNEVQIQTGVQFPLEEEVTLTFWYPVGWNFIGEMNALQDGEVWQYLKEMTNVNVEFIHPAEGTEEEAYSLLYASDKLPDILYSDLGKREYAAGAAAAVADGYFLDLTDMIGKYAPNYSAVLNSNEQVAKDVKTDDGQVLSFFHIYEGIGKACNQGPSVREEVLAQVGYKPEDLVTYDDWHDALTKIKEAGICETPLFISKKGVMEYNELTGGYGVAQDFINIDGTIKYGPCEPGYMEYVEMMNKWHDEGLIDSDFALNERDPEEGDVINGKYAAWWSYCSWNGDKKWGAKGVADDFNLIGTAIPVKTKGEKAHYRCPDTIVNNYNFHITTDCENPEVAIAYMDLFYNDVVALIANYGLGDTHVKNDDGTYSWSDKINGAEDVYAARGKYVLPNAFYENYNRVMDSWTDAQKVSQQNWLDTSDSAYVVPLYISMTAEENEEFASIMGDITTFVEEETAKMIAGNSSYDGDSFVAKIKELGIDRAIELKQAALDRYNAR
jgi:putative aldouronate transport system substrate-binding protein